MRQRGENCQYCQRIEAARPSRKCTTANGASHLQIGSPTNYKSNKRQPPSTSKSPVGILIGIYHRRPTTTRAPTPLHKMHQPTVANEHDTDILHLSLRSMLPAISTHHHGTKQIRCHWLISGIILRYHSCTYTEFRWRNCLAWFCGRGIRWRHLCSICSYVSLVCIRVCWRHTSGVSVSNKI